MLREFKGDSRILRIVMASSNPIETLHNLRVGRYSVITFFQLLELLDVKDTMQDDIVYREKINKQQQRKG